MHFVYVDDSKDDAHACFSAIILPASLWMGGLDHLVGMRRAMKASDNIYVGKEIHSTDWLGGRGKISPDNIPKGARARLFQYALSSIALLPGVQIINAHGPKAREEELFARLMNRIQRNMEYAGSHSVIFSDEGKSYDAMLRRMRRFNPIPSAYGSWGDGGNSKSIPLRRILEDLVYRDSSRSLFIQAADMCAFSLLRHENPTDNTIKYQMQDAFLILDNVLVKKAFAADPKKLGIIRA